MREQDNTARLVITSEDEDAVAVEKIAKFLMELGLNCSSIIVPERRNSETNQTSKQPDC